MYGLQDFRFFVWSEEGFYYIYSAMSGPYC